jgi:hypothetical protein
MMRTKAKTGLEFGRILEDRRTAEVRTIELVVYQKVRSAQRVTMSGLAGQNVHIISSQKQYLHRHVL